MLGNGRWDLLERIADETVAAARVFIGKLSIVTVHLFRVEIFCSRIGSREGDRVSVV